MVSSISAIVISIIAIGISIVSICETYDLKKYVSESVTLQNDINFRILDILDNPPKYNDDVKENYNDASRLSSDEKS